MGGGGDEEVILPAVSHTFHTTTHHQHHHSHHPVIMAPPKFADISKAAQDLFTEDFGTRSCRGFAAEPLAVVAEPEGHWLWLSLSAIG